MPGPKPRFKHTYAPKQNLVNLESHILNAENNRSNNFKNRIGLIIQIFLITRNLQMEIKSLLFFLRFIYLFMREREREREAETQAEGEAGSSQGARCGTRSQTPGSHPGPKADAQQLSHPGAPKLFSLNGVSQSTFLQQNIHLT